MEGDFETHITIRLKEPDDAERLRVWAHERGLKFVHILLATGLTPSQPMLTRHGRGTLDAELAIARQIAGDLRLLGFEATRIKLETTPALQTSSIAESDRYFESHVKLLIPASGDLQSLADIVQVHGGHLSRNALRTRTDGACERFVTQRCYETGALEAEHALDCLLAALGPFGYEILEIEKEFVVFDDNLSLDDGWLKA